MHDVVEKTANYVRGLVKHFHMVQTQLEQITKVQIDFLANMSNPAEKQTYGIHTWGGTPTQDPLYPEGHPKRIEQDSQMIENDDPSSPKKNKKKHKRAEEPENTNDNIVKELDANPNNVSISDAETENANEEEEGEAQEEEFPEEEEVV